MTPDLRDILRSELDREVEPAALELAAAARERVPGTQAVLFYGSCLRDGLSPDAVADLYLLPERYRTGQGWLAARANQALPPNVIYLEADTELGRLRAKAAIVTLDQFEKLTSAEAFHSYFWARFAQPAALIWAADAQTRARTLIAMGAAIETFAAETVSGPLDGDAADFWISGFQKTYASELRAEGPERAAVIFEADRSRYEAIFAELQKLEIAPKSTDKRWRSRRRLGKFLSIARLVKGIFTFDGGVDYILWKVERHTGVAVTPKAWERKLPLLGPACLAFRVWRRGGFR